MRDFTVSTPRPLPVIVLADVSGSMSQEGKIDALNTSIQQMLEAFAEEVETRAEIHVAIITFGHTAELHVPLTPAREVTWAPAEARGRTPLGAALQLAADLVNDTEQIPGRAYRPTVVVISDGYPTDDWRGGLGALNHGRGAKVDRMALAIGGDADEDMLVEFLGDSDRPVFHAEDARRINQFFRFVTMSVTARSRSANPNMLPEFSKLEDPFADLEY